MKRTHAGLLAGVLIVGTALLGAGWWAVRGISHLADEATDAAVSGVQGVVKSARSEAGDAARLVSAKAGSFGEAPVAAKLPAQNPGAQDVPTELAGAKTSRPGANLQVADAKQTQTSDIEDIQKILGPLLDENSADTPDIDTLLSGDKTNPDDWIAAIPGGNSETIRQWRQGKYKGKESQALEDAVDDPQIWRLVYFLSGGF